MDDLTYFLKLLAIFTCACILAFVVWIWVRTSRDTQAIHYQPQPAPTYSAAPAPPPPPKPVQVSRTVAFMPGQYIDLPNHQFRKIEIHSTFPIRVASGSCHLDYGVEFVCDSDPSDVFITDMRPKPIFRTPQGNEITITATQF